MPTGRALPILVYHNVAEPPPGAALPSLYVAPVQFDRQMRLLAAVGVQGVTLSEGLAWLHGGGARRVAAITLDDGYLDNFENALPILVRHGMRATCYVPSGQIGGYNAWDAERLGVRKPLMGEQQLRDWVTAGMEVGAHTRTHPTLSELADGDLEREVAGSRSDLEALLGVEVAHFCYPYGKYDGRVVDAVRRAGFASATTLRRARARASDDPRRLPRVPVRHGDPLVQMLLKLFTPYEDHRGRKYAKAGRDAMLP